MKCKAARTREEKFEMKMRSRMQSIKIIIIIILPRPAASATMGMPARAMEAPAVVVWEEVWVCLVFFGFAAGVIYIRNGSEMNGVRNATYEPRHYELRHR